MGNHFLIFLVFSVLIHSSLSAEKVLFGQPAPINAEGRQAPASDAAKDITPKDGRKARVFTFPGATQQQDSRTHQPAYVLTSPYEATEDRFSTAGSSAGLSDENRLLSLLPSFGENGMQVGLDFKLPFFSIPYAKMFNALSAPSIGGGLGSLLGGAGSSYGSPTASASSLTSNLLGSGSGISSTVATVAAMAVTAAMLYPKVTGLFTADGNTFRDGGSADDFFQNMNSVLSQFNIDGEACMKVALCSLGNAKRQHTRRGRDTTSSMADVVEDVLNLPAVKKFMNKGGLVQARDFGGSGGDCEYFNAQNKCPIAAQTFKSMLSKLG